MAEKVKTKFDWNDRKDTEVLIPCEHCKALDESFCCDDGVTASACNHCDYNIILHCLKNNMKNTHIIKKGDTQNDATQILNNYLKEVCKNSYRCQHCVFWHPNEKFCFFAYDCVKNDFNKMTEED